MLIDHLIRLEYFGVRAFSIWSPQFVAIRLRWKFRFKLAFRYLLWYIGDCYGKILIYTIFFWPIYTRICSKYIFAESIERSRNYCFFDYMYSWRTDPMPNAYIYQVMMLLSCFTDHLHPFTASLFTCIHENELHNSDKRHNDEKQIFAGLWGNLLLLQS